MKLNACFRVAGVAWLAMVVPGVLGAERAAPFYVANQNPFVQIFGLPRAESGAITPKGHLDAGFLYHVSNSSISADAGDESIIWDGETALYNLRFRYGVSERVELGMDVPYIDHSGGYLDSLIRHFHDLFSIPNERQEEFDKNQVHYQLRENGSTTFELAHRAHGLGDIRFTAALQLFGEAIESRRHLALRPMLKLPTGDSGDLLGSGGTDVAVGLAYSDHETLRAINTVLTANFGVLYMGNSDILRSRQRRFAGYGGLAADWVALDWLEFKLQLDVHSAFYDSALAQLGSSVQVLAGGTVQLPGEVALDLGMSQQLATDATPDVGFFLMAQRLF